MLKILKYCLLFTMFTSIIAQQPGAVGSVSVDEAILTSVENNHDADHTLLKKCKGMAKEIAIDAIQIGILFYVLLPIAVISHECGHVVAANALFDIHDPIQIHIGTTTPETTDRLFSLENMHFYKTIPWVSGVTTGKVGIKKGREALKNIDLGIMKAAGGLSAAAFLYALLSAITAYCAYRDNKGLFEISVKSFINGYSPFSYILDAKNLSYKEKRLLLNAALVMCLSFIFNIFYGCTPYIAGDGMELWEKHMGVTGTPLTIARGLSILGAWGCWAFLIKKYYDARKRLSVDYETKINLCEPRG